jgi:uncharacterized protein (TIGR02231 family)
MNIKKIVFVHLTTISCIISSQAQDTIYSQAQIESVTIFNKNPFLEGEEVSGGSQIYMESMVNLKKGMNTVVFRNLPFFEGFQIASDPAVEIISKAKHESALINEKEKSKEIEVLEKKTYEVEKEIDKSKSSISIFSSEREMILSNKSFSANNQSNLVESMRKLGDFYRQRIEEIDLKRYEANKKLDELTKELKKISEQIVAVKADKGETSFELIALVSSPVAGKAKFNISINEPRSSWEASYEVKVKDVKSPLDLHYMASIKQGTKVDWKNVKVSLSSDQPKKGNSCPELKKWSLDLYGESRSEDNFNTDAYTITETNDETETFRESISSFNYPLPQLMNIPGNGEALNIEMTNYQIPAIYEYQCVPKFDKDVFLKAKITDWGKYKLIYGKADLYFEGIYAGDVEIDNSKASDTLSFSLGRDKGILVERNRVEEYTRKTFLGGKQLENVGWEINILNNKKTDISLIVKDQLPISTRKEIEVEAKEISGAELDKQTGILQWKIQLKPGESKKLLLKYQVSYPKGKMIIIN